MSESVERRLLFGSVAERYDRYRPSYPATMVDAIIDYAGVVAGDRALEVGAGTGIATRQFAARGLAITAVEPDGAMAAVASQRAATDGTSVEVQIADFEHAVLDPHSFKLLYSGTAWHWVTPERRYALAGDALASGGALAAFWNRPVWENAAVRPGLDRAYAGLAEAFAEIYPGPMNPTVDPFVITADDWQRELAEHPEFTDLRTGSFSATEVYTRDQYLGLLGTHSDHILLAPGDRERLLEGVGTAIDEVGGSFELTYEALLCLARLR